MTWRYLFSLLLVTQLGGCTVVFRSIVYNVPKVTDARQFPRLTIPRSDLPFHFTKLPNQALPDLSKWVAGVRMDSSWTFEKLMEKSKTLAFLYIRNDSILYENYFDGYSNETELITFSLSKAVVTTLLGMALNEGVIKSLDQPIRDFLPEFKQRTVQPIRLRHLMNMTSGLNHDDYTSIPKLAQIYYTSSLDHVCLNTRSKTEPGTEFVYKTIDTQLLGWCLERAYGRRVADLTHEKVWQPLGMEYDGYWVMDRKHGREKMGSGLCTQARDLAKLGRLYLNRGNWNGKQLLPESWCTAVQVRDTTGGKWWGYAQGWWLMTADNQFPAQVANDYCASGFGGQSLYIHPATNSILVRLGGRRPEFFWSYLLSSLCKAETTPAVGDGPMAPEAAEAYCGIYRDDEGKEIRLCYQQGRLCLVPDKGEPQPLFAERTPSFISFQRDLRLMFQHDECGEAPVMLLDNFRSMRRYTRVAPGMFVNLEQGSRIKKGFGAGINR